MEIRNLQCDDYNKNYLDLVNQLSLLDKKTVNTLIIFENLTSGLSHHEFAPLSELLHQLSGSGNTVVVIDQNSFFDLIADHQIKF